MPSHLVLTRHRLLFIYGSKICQHKLRNFELLYFYTLHPSKNATKGMLVLCNRMLHAAEGISEAKMYKEVKYNIDLCLCPYTFM